MTSTPLAHTVIRASAHPRGRESIAVTVFPREHPLSQLTPDPLAVACEGDAA
jgi:hypothetical protein